VRHQLRSTRQRHTTHQRSVIVGYDREPDTLNRFSTHILEDIQTCVVEGLTTTDERMNVVPLLAADVPTLQNGGVGSVRMAVWTSRGSSARRGMARRPSFTPPT
jgi:hypothetical protein